MWTYFNVFCFLFCGKNVDFYFFLGNVLLFAGIKLFLVTFPETRRRRFLWWMERKLTWICRQWSKTFNSFKRISCKKHWPGCVFSPLHGLLRSADSPLLWIRIDPDMSILRKVEFEQADFMWQYQLRYERDVVAQVGWELIRVRLLATGVCLWTFAWTNKFFKTVNADFVHRRFLE